MLKKLSILKPLLLLLCIPASGLAATIPIPNNTQTTIQQGIDASVSGDIIEIETGTYNEGLVLKSGITLKGKETARVIIISPDSSPVVDIEGLDSVTIQNISFSDSTSGIEVTNSTNIIITNNVFALGTNAVAKGTAINVTDTSSSVEIFYNSFFANVTAIERNSDLIIQNNIFFKNTTDNNSGPQDTRITYNCFDKTTGPGTTNNAVTGADPLFVDQAINDFHLKYDSNLNANSLCVDKGTDTDIIDNTTADLGAYGGAEADPLPFPPQGVTATVDIVPVTPEITVIWSPNLDYRVTNNGSDEGGYRVQYDADQSGPPYGTILDVSNVTTATFPVTPDTLQPEKPVVTLSPSSQTLDVSWNTVENATSYIVNYGINNVIDNASPSLPSTTTDYTISGLTDFETYQVAVTAIFQLNYYIVVTTYDNTGTGFTDSNESDYSDEKIVAVGAPSDTRSDTVTAIPEPVVPFPNLPGEGCFIATAAYGYYSAPEVQSLRDFRDQFLLTNETGKAFVNWYYTHGPDAAQYIQTHTALKPLVRVFLYPLIIYSEFMTQTRFITQLATILLLMIFLFFFVNLRITYKNNNNATLN